MKRRGQTKRQMKAHDLKCWPSLLHQIITGEKEWEFRINDRDFQIGDTLHLREWDSVEERYGPSNANVLVMSIWNHRDVPGVPEGYVIMRIRFMGCWYIHNLDDKEVAGNHVDEVVLHTRER
jgi:hypothetical protein